MMEKILKTSDPHVTINVFGEPTSKLYDIFNSETGEVIEILFDKKEGITHEILLIILLDRLKGLCEKYEEASYKEPNEETPYDVTIYHLSEAIQELEYMEEVIKELGHVKESLNG